MKLYKILIISLLVLLLIPFSLIGQRYSTPQKTFEIYKEAAKIGDINIYLECMTIESRKMLQAQMPTREILMQEYSHLTGKEYGIEIKEEEDFALLYFKENTEYEPPYLFSRKNNEWKIDLKAMEERIYFDNDNKWIILGQQEIVLPKEDKP